MGKKNIIEKNKRSGALGDTSERMIMKIIDIINQKQDFCEGLKFAHQVIDGTASILILKDDGSLIAARDRLGRLPIIIGKNEDGYSVSFESYAFEKLGYEKKI